MLITGKKIGIFIGSLAILVSTFMAIINICFNKSLSYIAISTGLISGGILLMLCSNKNSKQN